MHHLFVSYATADAGRVADNVNAVDRALAERRLGVDVWFDQYRLAPGERWDDTIREALDNSIGLIAFISRNWAHSPHPHHELEMVSRTSDGATLVIPVLLEGVDLDRIPRTLQNSPLTIDRRYHDSDQAARMIADFTASHLSQLRTPSPLLTEVDSRALASDIAGEVRTRTSATADAPDDAVFVVHGHDSGALAELEQYLASVGVNAVILSRSDESPQSLFQKFMSVAAQAKFAITLLCPDDYGASREQYEESGVADRALQFRARQNVILELGFFYGKLGWENVFVVYRRPGRVFPNFERPSDLDGIVFDEMSDPNWRKKLGARLSAAGFKLRRTD
jgi:predicted nucleotide-binding protein